MARAHVDSSSERPPAATLSRPEVFARGADVGLGAAGLVLTATAAWALVQCVRRSWARARVVAAWSFWLSIVVQVAAWFVVPGIVAGALGPNGIDGGPSAKAVALGRTIAQGMNWTVPLMLGTPMAVAAWVVARRRMRRARRGRE